MRRCVPLSHISHFRRSPHPFNICVWAPESGSTKLYLCFTVWWVKSPLAPICKYLLFLIKDYLNHIIGTEAVRYYICSCCNLFLNYWHERIFLRSGKATIQHSLVSLQIPPKHNCSGKSRPWLFLRLVKRTSSISTLRPWPPITPWCCKT